jgi:hypothetical protein
MTHSDPNRSLHLFISSITILGSSDRRCLTVDTGYSTIIEHLQLKLSRRLTRLLIATSFEEARLYSGALDERRSNRNAWILCRNMSASSANTPSNICGSTAIAPRAHWTDCSQVVAVDALGKGQIRRGSARPVLNLFFLLIFFFPARLSLQIQCSLVLPLTIASLIV